MKSFLEVNVVKNFENFTLNVDFSMEKGYCVILGPTGAGKSLLLEIIAGIVKPNRGKVVLDGREITNIPPEKRGIGYVPQDYGLFPNMTVYSNVAYGLKTRGLPKNHIRESVKEVAAKLGISHLLNRKPGTLSGGEKQRVAIARALVIHPELILLDEPLSSVDLKTKERLIGELKFIHSEFDIPVVHVTHSLIETAMLADEVAVMMDGKIVKKGKIHEILSSAEESDFLNVKKLFRGLLEVFG